MTYGPAVKKAVSADAPFAVSVRLSAQSASLLAGDKAERSELREFMHDEQLYLLTSNAFPYGPFKGGVVKEQVYEPDWTTEDRVRYTLEVAEVLADLVPIDIKPSIQTAPLAFRPNVTGPDYIEAFTHNVLRVVAGLVDVERRTGRTVTLARRARAVVLPRDDSRDRRVFRTAPLRRTGAAVVAQLADLSLAQAHGALRRHLGVVFDICHQAVEFEDIPTSIGLYGAAGIPIFKLQEAAALWIPEVTADVVAELERYADTIYLTQTTQRRDGELEQFLNIQDAVAVVARRPEPVRVADPLPCTCVPRRSRPVPHDPVRDRGRPPGPRTSSGVGSPRDRDLHLGCATRAPQGRRHHHLRDARARLGQADPRLRKYR